MLLKQDFYFHSLGENRPLHIRIPDHGEPPFPVFYFFDGHNLFREMVTIFSEMRMRPTVSHGGWMNIAAPGINR